MQDDALMMHMQSTRLAVSPMAEPRVASAARKRLVPRLETLEAMRLTPAERHPRAAAGCATERLTNARELFAVIAPNLRPKAGDLNI